MCQYFDDIMIVKDINSGNVLLDKTLCKNIVIYEISYKTFMSVKPLCSRFHKLLKFMIELDIKC